MQKQEAYIYDIVMKYKYKGEFIQFDNADIHSLVIDEDYNKNHMPIIMTSFRCDKLIMNDMIDNMGTNTIILEVYKVLFNITEDNIKPQIKEKYIVQEMDYVITRDKVYDDSTVYNVNQLNPTISEIKYTNVSLGLIPKHIIDSNKKYLSGVYKNVRAIDILYDNANGMNLLVEPFDNNELYPLVIIPPMESFTQLIDYLQLNCGLYKDNYPRFFYDFDTTYILNQNGEPVEAKNELLNTVIINLADRLQDKDKIRGLIVDDIRRAYIMDIDPTYFDIKEDRSFIISSEETAIIDNMGEGEVNKEKVNVFRNAGAMKYSKPSYSRHYVNVIKTEVDGSIFTLNKEYVIKNYQSLNLEQSRFKLIQKTQLFHKYNGMYALKLILKFEKKYTDTN